MRYQTDNCSYWSSLGPLAAALFVAMGVLGCGAGSEMADQAAPPADARAPHDDPSDEAASGPSDSMGIAQSSEHPWNTPEGTDPDTTPQFPTATEVHSGQPQQSAEYDPFLHQPPDGSSPDSPNTAPVLPGIDPPQTSATAPPDSPNQSPSAWPSRQQPTAMDPANSSGTSGVHAIDPTMVPPIESSAVRPRFEPASVEPAPSESTLAPQTPSSSPGLSRQPTATEPSFSEAAIPQPSFPQPTQPEPSAKPAPRLSPNMMTTRALPPTSETAVPQTMSQPPLEAASPGNVAPLESAPLQPSTRYPLQPKMAPMEMAPRESPPSESMSIAPMETAPSEATAPRMAPTEPGTIAYSMEPSSGGAAPDELSPPPSDPSSGGAEVPAETTSPPPYEPASREPIAETTAESAPETSTATEPAAAPAEPPTTGDNESMAVGIEPNPAAAEMAGLPYVEEGEDSMTVTVFYGTDRSAIEVEKVTGADFIAWYLLAVLAGLGTLAVGSLAIWKKELRWPKQLAVGGTIATLLLAGWSGYLKTNTEPAKARTIRGYSNGRGELEMGTCRVSIPKTHEVGELESPSIMRLEFREDERKHVVLQDVINVAPEKFFADLKNCVERCRRPEAFVFIHGYNVTFENAARRTAQLAFDLKFQGAPIFYSWPSQGGLLQYAVDETNVVWTVPHLKEFLVGVAEKSGAEAVHLIAHSMGNRALTSALHQLSYEYRDQGPLFREVILTAPDIDAEVFRRDLAPAIAQTADRVTLYASSNDEALIASKKVHGYPRAGDSGGNLVVVPGIDTIDVSDVDTSLIGHSYYGSNDTVITDLAQLLHEAAPPERRTWLQLIDRGATRYWKFLSDRISRARDAVTTQ